MFVLEKLSSLKRAVSSSGSTVIGIRAAVPVGPRAAATRTRCLIRITLLAFGQLREFDHLGLIGAVSSSGSTVGGVRAAVPVGHWAAASRAVGLIRATLLAFGHLHQLGFPGLKGAVKGSGSTDGNIITAEPMGFRAATSRAVGPTRTLLAFAHLHQLGLPGLKGAVSGSGRAVVAIRAAEPVRHWATTNRAVGLIRATLIAFAHLHQLRLPGLKRAVSGSGSTDGNIITAEPIGFRAATTSPNVIAVGLVGATLLALGQLHEFGHVGLKWAVSGSGSTVGGIRAAVPVGHWAAASRAISFIRTALFTPGDQLGLFGFNLETRG